MTQIGTHIKSSHLARRSRFGHHDFLSNSMIQTPRYPFFTHFHTLLSSLTHTPLPKKMVWLVRFFTIDVLLVSCFPCSHPYKINRRVESVRWLVVTNPNSRYFPLLYNTTYCITLLIIQIRVWIDPVAGYQLFSSHLAQKNWPKLTEMLLEKNALAEQGASETLMTEWSIVRSKGRPTRSRQICSYYFQVAICHAFRKRNQLA